MYLLDKLRPQFLHWHLSQVLEAALISQRSDHGAAVALLEKALKHAADPILAFNSLTEAFLAAECFLKVIFARDWLLLSIDQL